MPQFGQLSTPATHSAQKGTPHAFSAVPGQSIRGVVTEDAPSYPAWIYRFRRLQQLVKCFVGSGSEVRFISGKLYHNQQSFGRAAPRPSENGFLAPSFLAYFSSQASLQLHRCELSYLIWQSSVPQPVSSCAFRC